MYEIIQYRLNLGSYERLNTGIIIAMISYSFIFKPLMEVSGVQWQWLDRLNSAPDHRLDIMHVFY